MDAIVLQGVRTHNLRNIDVKFPHGKFYVITGVSGSGKSSLAFDTLYAEGQRRFVESLSAYARQFLERMEKPDVDFVSGIPPAIALEAKNVITNARSTVGTQTEINDYLRVIFSRIGRTVCPDCHVEASTYHPDRVADLVLARYPGREAVLLFEIPLAKKGATHLREFLPELERQGFSEYFLEGEVISQKELLKKVRRIQESLSVCADRLTLLAKHRKRLIDSLELASRFGKGKIQVVVADQKLQFSEGLSCFACGRTFREPAPNLFSFNSPLGACLRCQGFGRVITIDWDLVIPDAKKSIAEGAVEPWTKPSASRQFEQLLDFCKRKKISTRKPWKDLSARERRWIVEGCGGANFFSVRDYFEYLQKKTYKMHVRIFLSKYRGYASCEVCHETRLKEEALWVRVTGKNVFEIQAMSLDKLADFFKHLPLDSSERERVGPVYEDIQRRIRFLNEVGLGYLTLSRLSRTLSGGEVQRIHLATSLGSALVETLYVLDEPSIGLHERDNRLLIRLLRELRDLGNTVVVVEHDRTMIEAADEVIDLGPLGGEQGGEIIFQGTVSQLLKAPHSLTGQYLVGTREVRRRETRKAMETNGTKWISIDGAAQHNLKEIDVRIPLRGFVVITGVSGSGKSTLLYDILYHHYLRYRGRPVQDLGKVRSVRGFEAVDELVLVDQTPVGRTPRSNPATYLKLMDEIRKIFCGVPRSRQMGYGPGHFSFNVEGGRCPVCKGNGRVKVEMHFLADVFVPCEECRGKRFKAEILDIRYEGKNMDDVLSMTVDEALEFFGDRENLRKKLGTLTSVGLGYLQLGQSATTLSGGEAQRLKLAYEMSEKASRHILYLFDEPTTGLHYHDIRYFMDSLEGLLGQGHSVVIIEHNMEIIRCADYVIDLGPEGGDKGGQVLYQGPLKDLLDCPHSYTARYLKDRMNQSSRFP